MQLAGRMACLILGLKVYKKDFRSIFLNLILPLPIVMLGEQHCSRSKGFKKLTSLFLKTLSLLVNSILSRFLFRSVERLEIPFHSPMHSCHAIMPSLKRLVESSILKI